MSGYTYDLEGYIVPLGALGGADAFAEAYNDATTGGIVQLTIEDIDDTMELGDYCSQDIIDKAYLDGEPIDCVDGAFVCGDPDGTGNEALEDIIVLLGGDPEELHGHVLVSCVA